MSHFFTRAESLFKRSKHRADEIDAVLDKIQTGFDLVEVDETDAQLIVTGGVISNPNTLTETVAERANQRIGVLETAGKVGLAPGEQGSNSAAYSTTTIAKDTVYQNTSGRVKLYMVIIGFSAPTWEARIVIGKTAVPAIEVARYDVTDINNANIARFYVPPNWYYELETVSGTLPATQAIGSY